MVIGSRLLDWYPPNTEPLPTAILILSGLYQACTFGPWHTTNKGSICPSPPEMMENLYDILWLDCADLSAMQLCSKYMFIQWTPIKVVKSLRLFGSPNIAEHRSSDTTFAYTSYNLCSHPLGDIMISYHVSSITRNKRPIPLSSHYFW